MKVISEKVFNKLKPYVFENDIHNLTILIDFDVIKELVFNDATDLEYSLDISGTFIQGLYDVCRKNLNQEEYSTEIVKMSDSIQTHLNDIRKQSELPSIAKIQARFNSNLELVNTEIFWYQNRNDFNETKIFTFGAGNH